MSRHRQGFALIEALVALTIITIVGTSTVLLGQAGVRTERMSREEERLLDDADRVLSAITLMRTSELDQRVGRHDAGEFIIDIQRPEGALYRIAVLPRLSPDRELLVTVLYRKPGTPS